MEISIITAQRAVTAAGTPEQIVEGVVNNHAISVIIRALVANTNDLYVTNTEQRATATTTGHILGPGEVLAINLDQFRTKDCSQAYIDLAKIWVDAAVNGEGFTYMAVLLQ